MGKKWFGCAVIGLAAILAAQPAVAGERSIQVRYSDLNLTNDRGREVLDRRLHGAVRQICGTNKAPGVDEGKDVRSCRTATLAQAMASRDKLFARLDSANEPLMVARVDSPSR